MYTIVGDAGARVGEMDTGLVAVRVVIGVGGIGDGDDAIVGTGVAVAIEVGTVVGKICGVSTVGVRPMTGPDCGVNGPMNKRIPVTKNISNRKMMITTMPRYVCSEARS